jgi:hypothetical protein
MTIVITGSLAYDYIMSFPGYFKDHILPERIHTISVSFLVDSRRMRRQYRLHYGSFGPAPPYHGHRGPRFQ